MSEFLHGATFQDYERHIIRAKTPEELTEFILIQGDKIKLAEHLMSLANEALSIHGTNIEMQLDKLQSETKTINP